MPPAGAAAGPELASDSCSQGAGANNEPANRGADSEIGRATPASPVAVERSRPNAELGQARLVSVTERGMATKAAREQGMRAESLLMQR